MIFGFQFMFSGPVGRERTDQPLSNFDIIGIPTENWSSHLFACYENILPSCIVSFCCPCIAWGQIVIRAQIPLFLGMKNTIRRFRSQSGYGIMVDVFFWTFIIAAAMFLIVGLVKSLSGSLVYFLCVIGIIFSLIFIYIVSITRTSFREK